MHKIYKVFSFCFMLKYSSIKEWNKIQSTNSLKAIRRENKSIYVNNAICFCKKKVTIQSALLSVVESLPTDTRDPQRPSGCQRYRSEQSLNRLDMVKLPFVSRVHYKPTVICQ